MLCIWDQDLRIEIRIWGSLGFESEAKKGGGGSLVQTLRNIDKEGSQSLIWAWGLGRNKYMIIFRCHLS